VTPPEQKPDVERKESAKENESSNTTVVIATAGLTVGTSAFSAPAPRLSKTAAGAAPASDHMRLSVTGASDKKPAAVPRSQSTEDQLSPLDPDAVMRKLSLSVSAKPKINRDGSGNTSANSDRPSVSYSAGGDEDIAVPLATGGGKIGGTATPDGTASGTTPDGGEEVLTPEQSEQVRKEIENLSRDSPYWPDNTVISKRYIGKVKLGQAGKHHRAGSKRQ